MCVFVCVWVPLPLYAGKQWFKNEMRQMMERMAREKNTTRMVTTNDASDLEERGQWSLAMCVCVCVCGVYPTKMGEIAEYVGEAAK